MNYPLHRLRIAVRRPNVRKSVYDITTLPDDLRSYAEMAIEELKNSGDPTRAKEYPLGQYSTISVWFEPIYRKIYHEPESWSYKWYGMDTPKPRWIKIRVWP